MATYNWYKEIQQPYGNIKPGSNWFHIRIEPGKQNMAAADVAKVMEIKNHWILKSGFYRITTPTTAAATADFGTTSGGQEISAAMDLDSANDTWVRFTVLDDDGPVPVTADGFLYFEALGATIYDGVIDIMIEIVVPVWDGEVDSIAE